MHCLWIGFCRKNKKTSARLQPIVEGEVIFTRRLSYEINETLRGKKKKKKKVLQHTDIHHKMYNMHLQNKYILC